MPTADEILEFIVAVANGKEKAESAGTRHRFEELYRDWFPEELQGENAADALRVLLSTYSLPHMWWCNSSPQIEHPTTWFGLNVARLRDRFRAIWYWVSEENLPRAKHLVAELAAETRSYWRSSRQELTEITDTEAWRVRTLAACEWLAHNLTRLRICKGPQCSKQRYFVRDEKNQKYCSPSCADRGHELLRLERVKASGVKPKRVLSPEAREAIAKAQRERHAKTRAANKEKAGLV
jgi:hypothetical protein